MVMIVSFAICVCSLQGFEFSGTSPTQEKLLVSANQALLGSIRTYYAETVRTAEALDGSMKGTLSSRYWREGDWYRIVAPRNRTVHEEHKRGKSLVITERLPSDPPINPKNEAAGLIAPREHRATGVDPWEESLFSLPVIMRIPPYPVMELSQAVQAGRVLESGEADIGEWKCIRLLIDLPTENRSYEVWGSLSLNGLLVQVRQRIRNDDGTPFWDVTHTVEEVEEAAPGIFVPTKTRFLAQLVGNGGVKGTTTMSNIRVNASWPPIPAMPTIPAGSMIRDKIENTVYHVDHAGRKIDRPRRVTGVLNPPAREPTSSLPWRSTMIVGLSFLGMLGALCVLVWIRRVFLNRVF